MKATIKRVDGSFYRDYLLYFDGKFVTLVLLRKSKDLSCEAARGLRERSCEQLRMLRKVQRGLNSLGAW